MLAEERGRTAHPAEADLPQGKATDGAALEALPALSPAELVFAAAPCRAPRSERWVAPDQELTPASGGICAVTVVGALVGNGVQPRNRPNNRPASTCVLILVDKHVIKAAANIVGEHRIADHLCPIE
jgi:hypothetical protein